MASSTRSGCRAPSARPGGSRPSSRTRATPGGSSRSATRSDPRRYHLRYPMHMRLYDVAVPQPVKMLGNVDRWLAAAIAHADRRKFDVNNLMKARLAPDQFTFDKQVQTACDNAKFLAGRLAGKDWPA